MVIQLTDSEGRQIKVLENASVDVELNSGERDFRITVSTEDYDKRMEYGCRVFVVDTEIGGILGSLETNTSVRAVSWSGFTWRGLMARKIIEPLSGEEYRIVSGELNDVLRELIEPMFGGDFVVPVIDTGKTISNYQFVRYCTLLTGITDMLKEVGYRLDIKYNQGEPSQTGYVEVQAVPIVDYSNEIELSQDSCLNFRMQDKRNGVNHLIVLSNGDLEDRTIVHLYVQKDGSIGDTKYYTGINEIMTICESTATNDTELRTEGIKRLQEIMNKKSFEMDVEALGIDVSIGDVVGGRDYNTGMYMAKSIENIIIKNENGKVTKEYRMEGN